MIGSVIFPVDPQGMMRYYISGIEEVATGAMLTMIANTMRPDAFEQIGSTSCFRLPHKLSIIII